MAFDPVIRLVNSDYVIPEEPEPALEPEPLLDPKISVQAGCYLCGAEATKRYPTPVVIILVCSACYDFVDAMGL